MTSIVGIVMLYCIIKAIYDWWQGDRQEKQESPSANIACDYKAGTDRALPHLDLLATNELSLETNDKNDYNMEKNVELYDVDEFARLKKAINGSNLNNSVTTVYTIDETGNNVDVHSKSTILFIPQIPDIEGYLRLELNEFFSAHRYVGIEMEKLRGQEASSNDDEEERGN